MKLQRHISRRTKEKVYGKWLITISDEIVSKLGWKQGTELKSEVSDNKLILSADELKAGKKKVKLKGEKKLSYFERFMLVYSNLPIQERKLPVVVVDGQSISWAMSYSEIKQKTKLGKIIGEKLIKLGII